MRPQVAPLFLAKAGYRRQRLQAAARLVPVFGVFLIFLPILWSPADGAVRQTAASGLYIFGVWAGLICVAAALAPHLRRITPQDPHDEASPDREIKGQD